MICTNISCAGLFSHFPYSTCTRVSELFGSHIYFEGLWFLWSIIYFEGPLVITYKGPIVTIYKNASIHENLILFGFFVSFFVDSFLFISEKITYYLSEL